MEAKGAVNMATVLIAAPENAFRGAVEAALEREFQIVTCGCFEDAARLIWQHQPQALLLDLQMRDALYLLEHLGGLLPQVVITVSDCYCPETARNLPRLGVSYHLLRSGGDAARCHLHAFLDQQDIPHSPQQITAMHLNTLGFSPSGGYEDLRLGAPLFAQDPTMPMNKVFYPAVANLRGRANWQQVEKAIRDAKQAAYRNRDDAVWQRYFPDTSRCPRNREFIARIAEFLR